MPPLEAPLRLDKMVVWDAVGNDTDGETIVSDTAYQLDVEWDWTRREVTDAQGETIVIDATVAVDREVLVGSIVWLGELGMIPQSLDFSQEANPLCKVASYKPTKDLKGRNVARQLLVNRFRGTLPTQT